MYGDQLLAIGRAFACINQSGALGSEHGFRPKPSPSTLGSALRNVSNQVPPFPGNVNSKIDEVGSFPRMQEPFSLDPVLHSGPPEL